MVAGIMIFIYAIWAFALVTVVYSMVSGGRRKRHSGLCFTLRPKLKDVLSRVTFSRIKAVEGVLKIAGIGQAGRMEKRSTIEGKTVRVLTALAMTALCLGLFSCAMVLPTQSHKEEDQASARDMARKMTTRTLAYLYEKNPAAQVAVEKAAGYAVFISFGALKGSGVAVDNASKEETFMGMLNLQPGSPVGVENILIVRIVFVFESPAAFATFVTSGLELGSPIAGKGKTAVGGFPGALKVSEGVYLYSVDAQGAILAGRIMGSHYYQVHEKTVAQSAKAMGK